MGTKTTLDPTEKWQNKRHWQRWNIGLTVHSWFSYGNNSRSVKNNIWSCLALGRPFHTVWHWERGTTVGVLLKLCCFWVQWWVSQRWVRTACWLLCHLDCILHNLPQESWKQWSYELQAGWEDLHHHKVSSYFQVNDLYKDLLKKKCRINPAYVKIYGWHPHHLATVLPWWYMVEVLKRQNRNEGACDLVWGCLAPTPVEPGLLGHMWPGPQNQS